MGDLARTESAVVTWVSLDDADDEPIRFLDYVLAALAGQGIGTDAPSVLAVPGAGPLSSALPLMLNDLAASPVPVVLVLDDVHVIRDPAIHEAIEYLVTYLPPQARLVIASRSDPPLPLARMRARGELTEVRADDLRFSRDDAAALLSAVAGTELDGDTADAAWSRSILHMLPGTASQREIGAALLLSINTVKPDLTLI